MKKNLSDVQNSIWKLCLALFLLLSAYVLVYGIFFWSGLDDCYQDKSVLARGAVMILGLSFLGLLWIFISRIVHRLPDRLIVLLSVVGFVLLFFLQLQFLLHEPCQLRYDALKVFDEALSMLRDQTISNAAFDGYFARYTNNYAITILAYFILKTSAYFGLLAPDYSNALFILQVVGTVIVDLSYLFGYLTISAFAGRKPALVCLLFILTSPLSYVWLPFFYTNGISMAFAMGTIYLLLEITRHDYKHPAILLLCGLMIPSGYYIRATQVVFCIALLIFLFIAPRRKISMPWLTFGIIALGMFIAISDYHVTAFKYADYNKDSAFPAVHWVAMGLNEDSGGTFDTLDETYTMSFPTIKEKKAADRQLLKDRLKELGIVGVTKLYFHKLRLTFSDGTGGYPTELSISRSYDDWYQNVYGNNRFGLQYTCQLNYLFILLASAVGAGLLLFEKKWYGFPAFCIYLAILGAYLFQMIWEAGTIYSTGYICLFYTGFGFAVAILAGDGFAENLLTIGLGAEDSEQKVRKKETENLLSLGFTAVCLCTAFASFLTYDYTQFDEARRVRLSVNQYQYASPSYEPCLPGMTLTQTFTADMPFDEVYLLAENAQGASNDSVYHISILDADGETISETELAGSEVVSYGLTKLDLSSPKTYGNYSLTIKKLSGTNSLSFLYYDTGNYDAYPDGVLTGLTDGKKPDLAFIVLKVVH